MTLKRMPLFLLLALAFQNCNKTQDNFKEPPSHHETQLHYGGSDSTIHLIVDQLNEPRFASKVKWENEKIVPNWNKHIWSGALGDSLQYLLIPLTDDQEVLKSYLRVGISQKNVLQASLIDYESDYIKCTDSSLKTRFDADLSGLYKYNVKLPGSFSIEEAIDRIKTADKKWKKTNIKRKKQLNARSNTCTALIDFYYYTTCNPTIFNAALLSVLSNNLQAIGGEPVDIWGYGELFVSGPAEVITAIEGHFYQAFDEVSSQMACTAYEVGASFSISCDGDGGGDPGTGPDPCGSSCTESLDAMAANSQVVSEILPSDILETGSPITKFKNTKWRCLKNLTWSLQSYEKGLVKLIDVNEDKWQWESLEHDKIDFLGISVGGDVAVESHTGTPSFTAGTPNVLYAGMKLDFTVRYSVICDCPLIDKLSFTQDYEANAVWDAKPRND